MTTKLDALVDDDYIKLVVQAQAGDKDAFVSLVDKYGPIVHHYISHECRIRADADDLLQDTIIRAYTGIKDLRNPKAFYPWIIKIARNLIVDYFRHEYNGGVTFVRDSAPDYDTGDELSFYETVEGSESNPESSYLRTELATKVRYTIRQLPDNWRTVILMHHFEDLELVDMAAMLGIAEGTAKSRLNRARDDIKHRLGYYFATRGDYRE